ncbi:hypothetical protein [Pontiella desulfatans]|nr:hypothetical protein [Pontiella desulfatans]
MNRICMDAPQSGALECGDGVSAFKRVDVVGALQGGFAALVSGGRG